MTDNDTHQDNKTALCPICRRRHPAYSKAHGCCPEQPHSWVDADDGYRDGWVCVYCGRWRGHR